MTLHPLLLLLTNRVTPRCRALGKCEQASNEKEEDSGRLQSQGPVDTHWIKRWRLCMIEQLCLTGVFVFVTKMGTEGASVHAFFSVCVCIRCLYDTERQKGREKNTPQSQSQANNEPVIFFSFTLSLVSAKRFLCLSSERLWLKGVSPCYWYILENE